MWDAYNIINNEPIKTMTLKENLKMRKQLEAEKNRLRDWSENSTSDEEYFKREPIYLAARDKYYDFCRENPTPTEGRLERNRNFRRRCGLLD